VLRPLADLRTEFHDDLNRQRNLPKGRLPALTWKRNKNIAKQLGGPRFWSEIGSTILIRPRSANAWNCLCQNELCKGVGSKRQVTFLCGFPKSKVTRSPSNTAGECWRLSSIPKARERRTKRKEEGLILGSRWVGISWEPIVYYKPAKPAPLAHLQEFSTAETRNPPRFAQHLRRKSRFHSMPPQPV